MTYLSDKSRTNKKRFYYFIIICVLFIVVYFWPIVRVKLYPIVEPVILVISSGKNMILIIPSSIHTYFSSREEMNKQNIQLANTVERLENAIAEKDAIIKESSYIEENGTHLPSSTIILYPIMKDITSMYSSILFSKGFKNGVEEKATVYLRGRQPICTITSVFEKTSLCKLFSASGVQTDGVTSSSIILPLIGMGGGSFIADVSRSTNVTIGDMVYLASDQTMILGTITDVIRNDQDTALHVYVRGAYNPLTSSVFYINK